MSDWTDAASQTGETAKGETPSAPRASRVTRPARHNRTYGLSEAAVNALEDLYEAGVARGERTTRGDLVDAAIRHYAEHTSQQG